MKYEENFNINDSLRWTLLYAHFTFAVNVILIYDFNKRLVCALKCNLNIEIYFKLKFLMFTKIARESFFSLLMKLITHTSSKPARK